MLLCRSLKFLKGKRIMVAAKAEGRKGVRASATHSELCLAYLNVLISNVALLKRLDSHLSRLTSKQ